MKNFDKSSAKWTKWIVSFNLWARLGDGGPLRDLHHHDHDLVDLEHRQDEHLHGGEGRLLPEEDHLPRDEDHPRLDGDHRPREEHHLADTEHQAHHGADTTIDTIVDVDHPIQTEILYQHTARK